MPISRRKFVRIAGSSTVVLAAAGVAGYLGTRDPVAARAPWARSGAYPDPIRRALSYAILAPNPHNRQPWLVDLTSETEATLYCDMSRLLPQTDPFDRQIAIGLGCFLELLDQAAGAENLRAEIAPFPEGTSDEALDGRPVARIRLLPGGTPDPLFGQVHARRSNKEPFDTAQPVSDANIDAIVAVCGPEVLAAGTNSAEEVEALRDLTWRAHKVEVETPRTLMESVELMRIGRAEIEASPDGIDLGGPFLETLRLFGLMTRSKLADPDSTAFQQGLEIYQEIINSAMGHFWLITPDNSRGTQLAAGRAYVRANLKATELGLGMHPLSQALQEYREMSALYDELNDNLQTPPGARLQLLARLGYGPELDPSPRWPLESRIAPT